MKTIQLFTLFVLSMSCLDSKQNMNTELINVRTIPQQETDARDTCIVKLLDKKMLDSLWFHSDLSEKREWLRTCAYCYPSYSDKLVEDWLYDSDTSYQTLLLPVFIFGEISRSELWGWSYDSRHEKLSKGAPKWKLSLLELIDHTRHHYRTSNRDLTGLAQNDKFPYSLSDSASFRKALLVSDPEEILQSRKDIPHLPIEYGQWESSSFYDLSITEMMNFWLILATKIEGFENINWVAKEIICMGQLEKAFISKYPRVICVKEIKSNIMDHKGQE